MVRKMKPEEHAAAIAILAQWNMAPLSPSDAVPSPERSELDPSRTFVAVDRGAVVGVASYIVHSEELGETASLAVASTHRGTGAGFRLQCARLEAMRRLGLRRVRTETDRAETIAWYIEKFGYREIGQVPKKHDFSLKDVDTWTILELDLENWQAPTLDASLF